MYLKYEKGEIVQRKTPLKCTGHKVELHVLLGIKKDNKGEVN